LLEALGARGLRVTRTMLAEDVRGGYQPSPRKVPRGYAQGIGRLWEPWAVQRALYLYRLRRRGAQGATLRVLLFLRDGWGFERIQPIAEAGLDKYLDMVLSPVLRHHRRPPTHAQASYMAEDYEAHVPQPTPALDLASWGLLLFGRPLEGSSLRGVAHVMERMGYEHADKIAEYEWIYEKLGFNADRLREAVKDTDPERWRVAAECTREHVQRFRRLIRKQARGAPRTPEFPWSTNPLSMFALPKFLKPMLRELPRRPTPAQLLAGIVPLAVLLHEWIDDGSFSALGINDDATLA